MAAEKRKAADAELEGGSSEKHTSAPNLDEDSTVKHDSHNLGTAEGIWALAKTPYLGLLGSDNLIVCIILRFIISAHQHGADLFIGKVSQILIQVRGWP